MVNIIGRTQEERDLEKMVLTLQEKSKNILKQEKKDGIFSIYQCGDDSFGIRDGIETPIFVHFFSKQLTVKFKRYFDLGFKLAQAYEEETKQTWSLKRDYD